MMTNKHKNNLPDTDDESGIDGCLNNDETWTDIPLPPRKETPTLDFFSGGGMPGDAALKMSEVSELMYECISSSNTEDGLDLSPHAVNGMSFLMRSISIGLLELSEI